MGLEGCLFFGNYRNVMNESGRIQTYGRFIKKVLGIQKIMEQRWDIIFIQERCGSFQPRRRDSKQICRSTSMVSGKNIRQVSFWQRNHETISYGALWWGRNDRIFSCRSAIKMLRFQSSQAKLLLSSIRITLDLTYHCGDVSMIQPSA